VIRAATLAGLACLVAAAASAPASEARSEPQASGGGGADLAGAVPARPDPAVDYMLQCQGCHRADGSGSPGAVPDLRGSLARFPAVAGGREYLVRVPGAALSPLSDQRLAALLDWMLREFGPAEAAAGLAPYRAEEVARWRAQPYLEVQAVRLELLRRIEARAVPES
jgi:mono/diheme cytochrome c family protein